MSRTPLKSSSLIGVLRFKEASVLVILLLLWAIFSIVTPTFLSSQNILVMMRTMPELGIIAVGVTFLMISQEFDLSVGSTFAFAPFIMTLLVRDGVGVWVALLVCLAIGMLIGLINGVVTVRAKIPSFITTLGAMMVWRGATLLVSGGFPETFEAPEWFNSIFTGEVGPIPVQFLWFVAILVLLWSILEHHRYGNWVFVTGSNTAAARALGVATDRVKIINFMIVGALAAFAGFIQVSRLGSVNAIQGNGLELQAIAAAVIGGTALMGGSGSIIGTFLGTVIIFSVNNVLILSRAPAFWFNVFLGIILVAAVISHTYVSRKLR